MSYTSLQKRAFSLVEMLVVIAIISILAGFIMSSVWGLRSGTQTIRTETIIETMRQAIELTATEQGSYPNPAEHPLAGTYGASGEPRSVFKRSAANGGATLDGTVATTGEAIRGVTLANLPASYDDRLLLNDDIFADTSVPSLFGLTRDRIGLLGASLSNVSRYRLLPSQDDPAAELSLSDLTTLLADDRYLVSSVDDESANALTIDYVLGSTNAKTELSKLNDKTKLNELDALYHGSGSGELMRHGRVWNPGDTKNSTNWKHGYLYDSAAGAWRRYRVRGLAIYDAWGVEIMYSISERGQVRLMSAGRDGSFAINLGENEQLETTAGATSFGGDDIDGWKDNVILVTDDR